MAACTSRAAPLMSRLSPNCMMIWVLPTEEVEVISVTSAIWPRRRSRGVATLVDITDGLAPGRLAWTWMVGRSTAGRDDTGSWK